MKIYLIIAAVAALIASATTWQVQDWRYGNKERERLEAEAEARKMREKTITAAATQHETAKAAESVRYRTVIKYVDRIIDRPVYTNICIDQDGLDAINNGVITK